MIRNFVSAIKKSGLAAFFVLAGAQAVAHQAIAPADLERRMDELGLDRHPVWSSLLHLEAGQPQIHDSGFVLSQGRFSPRAELSATLAMLYADAQAVCRFPARYLWLQDQLNLPKLPLDRCPEWKELRIRAPLDTLSLVFVTESVVLPASMMGHAFLELSGRTPDGQLVAHALSFYTPAETYNLPKLYWQAMVTGKQGVFALAPFEEVRAKYLEDEKRNLWLYRLQTSEKERMLIQAHMLELKQTRLLYWFHSYNCATLLRNLLALSGRMPPSREPWETPKDLVRAATQAGLVSRTEVLLTNEWLVDQLHQRSSGLDAGQRDLLSKARLDVLLANQRITLAQWEAGQRSLAPQEGQISLATDLDPAHSQPDAQMGFSLERRGAESRGRLTFVPMSHQFLDRQAQSQAETELEFMSAAISWAEAARVRLDQLNIYAMRSLNPWNDTTRRLSSEFKVGYGQSVSHSRVGRGWQLRFGLGATWRLHPRADFYGLGGVSQGKGAEGQQSWGSAEVGTVLRLTGQTKAAWSVKSMRSIEASHDSLQQSRWSVSHSTSSSGQAFLHFTRSRVAAHQETALEAGFKYLF